MCLLCKRAVVEARQALLRAGCSCGPLAHRARPESSARGALPLVLGDLVRCVALLPSRSDSDRLSVVLKCLFCDSVLGVDFDCFTEVSRGFRVALLGAEDKAKVVQNS